MWFIPTSVRLIPVSEHVHLFSERVQKYNAGAGPSQQNNLSACHYSAGGSGPGECSTMSRRMTEGWGAKGEWGVGNGEWDGKASSLSPLPIPHSPFSL